MRKIAWIEDDIDVIDPVVQPLRQAGFEILEFRSYSEAIEDLRSILDCDLILLDLILPPGRLEVTGKYLGLEVLRHLRAQNVRIPVIIFSVVANARDVQQTEIQRLGATSISKPARPSQLKAKVFERLGILE